MAEIPTPAELDGLMTGAVPQSSTPGVPPPSPKVVARAKEIVTGTDQVVATIDTDPLTDDDRVRFLAHVLSGKPFQKTYELFGVLTVEFGVISATAERLIQRALGEDEAKGQGSVADRKARYTDYSVFLAIRRLEFDGADKKPKCPTENPTVEDLQRCALGFYAGLTKPVYQALRTQYGRFNGIYKNLMGRAQDSPFWTTPSSAP